MEYYDIYEVQSGEYVARMSLKALQRLFSLHDSTLVRIRANGMQPTTLFANNRPGRFDMDVIPVAADWQPPTIVAP